MIVTIDPVLFSLGPLAIRWFGVLTLAGVLVAIVIGMRNARRDGIAPQRIAEAAAWVIPVAVIGARLTHVVGAWDYYLTHPQELWQPGMYGLSIWGAILFGGLTAASIPRPARLTARLADAIAPGLAVGIAIGRLGSFIDGDGQGVPTSVPWATQYTNSLAAVPDFGIPRHPVQVYDGIAALAIVVILFIMIRRPHLPGLLFWTFLTLYALVRICLQPLRLEPSFLFGMPLDELIAIAALLFTLVRGWIPLLARRRPNRRQSFFA